jgi:FkbM family methyltransferase
MRSFIRADLHSTAASKVVYANPPDWEPMQAWRAVLRRGDLFIDVGASVGAYTLWAAELGAHVIAIEPDRRARMRLRDNLALNDYDVTVLPVVLADRRGRMLFTKNLDTQNRLVLGDSIGELEAVHAVPAETLDTVLGNRCAAGVKVDVEGAERLVLEGARQALAEHRISLLQLEWNSASLAVLGEDRSPVAELLTSLGYRLYRPTGEGKLVPVGVGPAFGEDVFARPEPVN